MAPAKKDKINVPFFFFLVTAFVLFVCSKRDGKVGKMGTFLPLPIRMSIIFRKYG